MSWLDAPKSEHIIRREHFVAGVETERERIIALLEDQRDEHWIYNEVGEADAMNQAIALIKGENK